MSFDSRLDDPQGMVQWQHSAPIPMRRYASEDPAVSASAVTSKILHMSTPANEMGGAPSAYRHLAAQEGSSIGLLPAVLPLADGGPQDLLAVSHLRSMSLHQPTHLTQVPHQRTLVAARPDERTSTSTTALLEAIPEGQFFTPPVYELSRLAIDRPAVMPASPAPSAAPSQGTSRISAGNTSKLTSFFVRPGYGERGRPIEIESNFFAVRTRGNARGRII